MDTDPNKPLQAKPQTDFVTIEEKVTKPSGQIYTKKYLRGRILGKGGFAKCYQATNMDTKKLYAIKIVNKQTLKKSKAKQKLITEIKIHKILSHKNVVLFDHVFEDSENVYILLELCSHHTLNEMIKKRKRISQLELQYFISQIIEGMAYIHSSKVIHRDLKLGNLMIGENMQIKIGDFGLAAKIQYNNEKKKTICGTPNYIAPQILEGKGHSYEVDIWSIGVIMFAMLYGRPPFETSDVKKTYKKIKSCEFTFNDDISVGTNAKNLISKILVTDPSKRPTLQQIMQHPFMACNKIPKSIPTSSLSTQLDRNFVDQHISSRTKTPFKKSGSSQSVEKRQTQIEKTKSAKEISERLLLRTSPGFGRNLLMKKQKENSNAKKDQLLSNKDDMMAFSGEKPTFLSNNYFNIIREMESMNYVNGGKSTNGTTNNRIRDSLANTNTTFVKKWVDYSSKYGLGYLLSDGTTGIYFNDNSKIVINSQNQKVDYIPRESSKDSSLLSFSMTDIPDSRQISKKVTLMQYFRKYLNGSTSQTGTNQEKKHNGPPFCYIKGWLKTDEGIIFRLNNKLIQVNFVDKSQLVIYSERGIMVYTGPNHGTKTFYQLSSLDIPKSAETYKKLEVLKEMLRKLNMRDKIQDNNETSTHDEDLMIPVE